MNKVRELLTSNHREQICDISYNTVEHYKLIEENDHVAVSIEGNRNSLLMHACIDLYRKKSGINFEVSYLLVPNEYASLDDLIKIARKWEIKQYHIVNDKTEEGYLDYAQKLGCNKIAVDLNRDFVIKRYMARLIEKKRFASISPRYELSERDNFVAIYPFFYVQEKEMDEFAKEGKDMLCEVLPKAVKNVASNSDNKLDIKNAFQLNVYESV